MPFQSSRERDGYEMEIPKEAKSHASFRQVVAVQDLRDQFRTSFFQAMSNPTPSSIANAGAVIKMLWFETEMIIKSNIADEINAAFGEYGYWYNQYRTSPGRRNPQRKNSMLQAECLRRLEEIYRKINLGLQILQWLYKISDAKQNLDERLKLIDDEIYGGGKRRKGKNIQKLDGG